MKKLFIIFALFTAAKSNAQWENKIADNGFDEPYRYAVCYTSDGKNFVKLEKLTDTSVLVVLYEGYICEERPKVEYSFKVGGLTDKYDIYGIRSTDKKRVMMSAVVNESNFVHSFKYCSIMRIRLNDESCGSEIYAFDMTYSEKALIWVMSDRLR